jgi:hypothetical protein
MVIDTSEMRVESRGMVNLMIIVANDTVGVIFLSNGDASSVIDLSIEIVDTKSQIVT